MKNPTQKEFFLDKVFRPKDHVDEIKTFTEQTAEEIIDEHKIDNLNTNGTNTDDPSTTDSNKDNNNLPSKESSNYHMITYL